MTLEIAFVLLLVVAVATLMITERLRPDLAALLVLVILGLTGLIGPEELFSGFSRQAVITLLALSIIAEALDRTGVTHHLGRILLHASGGGLRRTILTVTSATALLSLVMNTVAAAAVLLPATMGMARTSGRRPSRLLMPLAFGSLLGGMATLFTTANILVSNALSEKGYPAYGVLDFIPLGLPMALAGIAVITLLGPRLLPDRARDGEREARPAGTLMDAYQLRQEVQAAYVKPNSPMAGQTLAAGGWGERLGLNVLAISRGGAVTLAPPRTERVREGDIVMYTGQVDAAELQQYGLVLTQDPDWNRQLASDQVSLIEVSLAPRSSLAGKTLREMRFRDKYNLTVLAIWREGNTLRDALAEIPLRFGDALLMQGTRRPIELLRRDSNFLVLTEDFGETEAPLSPQAWIVLALTTAAVIVPALGLLPIAETTFAAAVMMILLGCLSMEEAYAAIEWRSIFMIAGMLPLGMALTDTGAAGLVGEMLVGVIGGFGPLPLAGGLFIFTVAVTQIIGGQVTPVVLAPIAIAAAEHLGLGIPGVRALAMAVALGCSTAFLTPVSHSVNLLVMGPGAYRFNDYPRLGIPVTLALLVVLLVGLAVIWGF
ncbi:MAG TPA: SLC13 family permease [Anaerolineales bacterium]|nr:SLC13 family permease [Anaerolineales bacterium]